MKITDHIHALRIPFQIPVSPHVQLDRFVYLYLLYGKEKVFLVDSGVKGSERLIVDYLKETGRSITDVSMLLLTHAHPDHLGGAREIRRLSGCGVAAHEGEKHWIEDTEQQFKDRPVPGFHALVGGPVRIERALHDGDHIDLDEENHVTIYHTPGHSPGSISIIHEDDHALICGDAIPVRRTMPIYEDVVASVESIRRLQRIREIDVVLSSWDEPRLGPECRMTMTEGLSFLQEVHDAVRRLAGSSPNGNVQEWAGKVFSELGIPQAAMNPLVLKSLAAHVKVVTCDLLA